MTGWTQMKLMGVMLMVMAAPMIGKQEAMVYKGTTMTSVRICMETMAAEPSCGSDLAQQVGHFNGGEGGVEALVPAFGARAFDGLLQGVGGEHSEDDGLSRLERHLGDTL
jgi:hypothetical protein